MKAMEAKEREKEKTSEKQTKRDMEATSNSAGPNVTLDVTWTTRDGARRRPSWAMGLVILSGTGNSVQMLVVLKMEVVRRRGLGRGRRLG